MRAIVFLMLVAVLAMGLGSCKKYDPLDPESPGAPLCVKNNWGVLGVENRDRLIYNVFIDDSAAGQVIAYEYKEFLLPPGDYEFKYVQDVKVMNPWNPWRDSGMVSISRCVKTKTVITR